ncbi:hypothetical protein ABKN59_010761 [Abortiporus biennis]
MCESQNLQVDIVTTAQEKKEITWESLGIHSDTGVGNVSYETATISLLVKAIRTKFGCPKIRYPSSTEGNQFNRIAVIPRDMQYSLQIVSIIYRIQNSTYSGPGLFEQILGTTDEAGNESENFCGTWILG